MKTWLFLLLCALLTGCQRAESPNTPLAEVSPTACPDDVKYCADGQQVHRDPVNDCAFTACPEPKACTRDLNICDNGRRVGRDPLNDCEFYPCEVPGKPVKEPMMCTQDVKQCADGSYVGRDPYKNCAFKPCPSGLGAAEK